MTDQSICRLGHDGACGTRHRPSRGSADHGTGGPRRIACGRRAARGWRRAAGGQGAAPGTCASIRRWPWRTAGARRGQAPG